MKFRKPLDDIFQTPSSVRVLRVLVHSELDLTGRQIADMAGLNPQTCQNTLDRLNELHLLATRRVGRAYLYRLRRENVLVQKLLTPLLTAERDLLPDELSRVAERFEGTAIAVILFGSVARGEEAPGSDIDLCVITGDARFREAARTTADEVLDQLTGATGLTPTIIVWTRDEFRERFNKGDDLARSILEEGQSVMGPPVYELLRDGEET